jgi:periplasmic glucans biosynthesis protein
MQWGLSCALILIWPLGLVPAAAASEFADVREKAEALAARRFVPATLDLPDAIAQLSYDDYRRIRFKDERTLWKKEHLPFQVQLFHPGGLYRDAIVIHELERSNSRTIPFDPEDFDYGGLELPETGPLAPAGFRVDFNPDAFGEAAVFLGASYFRMIGRGHAYGTSARGLALNTALAQPEEFPLFREFWLRKPAPHDRELTVYALLDSPSATGAYRFQIRPGETTVTRVKCSIFLRRPVERFGIAPLTSMFWRGENDSARTGDHRPEVHDADGLLVHTGPGELLWRPLSSGPNLRLNSFTDANPRGFGLLQRDRRHEHYLDGWTRYELRPSVWVKPLGAWGKGSVVLVQFPTHTEYFDNIVAWWAPQKPPRPGEPLDLEYELHWTLAEPGPASVGRARATRIQRLEENPGRVKLEIEFGGAVLAALSGTEPVKAQLDCRPAGKIIRQTVEKIGDKDVWRLTAIFEPPAKKAAELRVWLRRGPHPLTETWTYTWQP